MVQKQPPTHPVDLDLLDTYLMSDRSPAGSMGLSDLDGFLTGLAIGPEAIRPTEWMRLVWGEDEPEFDTPEEAEVILGAIMARYNEILDTLESDPDNFDPVFLEGPDGDPIVTDWAAGFMDAVILRTKAWAPLLQDEAGRSLMLPLLVMGSDDERPLFDVPPLPEDAMDEMFADGPDVIIESVLGIAEYFADRRTP